ncbi:hypothetical protein HMPREF9714_02481 [Myroides odoratimimus CCUG 12901]|uniref:Uncharacterized protein n=1 Tax=Myroides odoratimimus CIP 101113 TaxID=883154 RepID=A0AAV3F0Z3_9FLAO|nr:hypothetical protein HMPREF9714_02481 [Myroides odoratimimus CCUG 12901]EHO08968.1 hypothetical protein HMPREF9715_02574 [Myroides odoratimimus CIP 101113]EPH13723.1 hypothetical protein HMPREF9713_00393 [Myroides odoratimimus CCUG 12700]
MHKKNRIILFSILILFVLLTFSCFGQEKVKLNHFLNQLENSNRYEFLKNSYKINENNYKIFNNIHLVKEIDC